MSAKKEGILFSVRTAEKRNINPGRRYYSSMNWSPDGRYLLVPEAGHVPYGAWFVYRVQDGAWDYFTYGLSNPTWQWILVKP